ncbi:FKBP prolyl isomerase 16 [Thunnus albacares]|uniref:FKBP prolyl isomerase 16 n=1 Tax=Thunnus maccoyii TaxID=8240 RepID=UPI001C4D2B67|nr:FKBP prolyl isomerase 16 [Thunnus maccoyii]XP_042268927.1 FKBP prolyl isomerase 16 [Thunnus maccoyii]XP_042268928.1 FKBP prolyl isomerase 16 [Thunnus maccoyii]XP_042268929.1 FKBP prolyl isomerase 16 [Thunnus maccoyii]XP_042268930.1 FKBP prolyl isomerase 16 [Thunnus maccoyii]XP_042268931.1 FKBP prolyl isomerase 16 [Thunnus maccoyii]XP_044211772.1 FKBP prolyl isomerase 16 [Thunnus albacares]XP_044211773.1 FKBP prolyl isomerase 16 [Thunnus albacares]XP_044211774.1 FKBP prolyl isomerase 16 [|eukprot:superscaffoldBa00002956_g15739
MQMVSIALCGKMEEPCCEDHKDPVVEPTEPEVRDATSEPADRDGHTELPCGPAEESQEPCEKEQVETESCAGETKSTEIKSPTEPEQETGETECKERRKLRKTNSWKMVRFQDPSTDDEVLERDSSAESLFPEYAMEEWTSSTFEELFVKEDWQDITDDRLLRKKVLECGDPSAPQPTWGQEVTVKMQCVLEDRTVVEKDCKLVFVIGEGDVNQALEECVISMQKGEITLLLADSQYAYGLLGREPDIPAWAPLLYQLQLLDVREKPDPLTLPVADRIRIGNQKRERGNFHFQREEYSMAARAYCMALDVLTTRSRDGNDGGVEAEEEEVHDYRVKCLNNLAASQLKLEQYNEALHTSRDVLALEPNNVKALFRTGKLLSDMAEYKEAMEVLKKALKLEPATKAIHVELSKLVKRQSGGNDTQEWKAKPAEMLGDNIAPFLIPSKKKPSGISWKLILGALVVALGSLVTSVILTARN